MNNEKRSSFTGKIGFVLAAAGSAVGLGNIWRFPYLAAKYGGGIFLLVYILLAVTFGFALMIAEISIGRKTGLSAIGAFKSLNRKFSFLGWMDCGIDSCNHSAILFSNRRLGNEIFVGFCIRKRCGSCG